MLCLVRLLHLSLFAGQFWRWDKWSTIWVEGFEVKFAWNTNVFYGDFLSMFGKWICIQIFQSLIGYCLLCLWLWHQLREAFECWNCWRTIKVNNDSRSAQRIGYFMHWEKLLDEVDSNTIINDFASRNIKRNFWDNMYKDLKLFWYIIDFYHSKICLCT